VRVEQFIVVGAGLLAGRDLAEIADRGVGVGWKRVAVCVDRHCVVRDVIEERVPGAERVGRNRHALAAVGRRLALDEDRRGRRRTRPNHLREAVQTGLEMAVRVGDDQRYVENVGVDESVVRMIDVPLKRVSVD